MQKSVGWVLLWFGTLNLILSITLFAMGMTTGKFVGVPGMIAWSVILVVMGVALRNREEPPEITQAVQE